MQYEWDENKRIANLERHKVDFLEAIEFEWDSAFETIDDRFDYGETRWVTIGFIKRKLYVMFIRFVEAGFVQDIESPELSDDVVTYFLLPMSFANSL